MARPCPIPRHRHRPREDRRSAGDPRRRAHTAGRRRVGRRGQRRRVHDHRRIRSGPAWRRRAPDGGDHHAAGQCGHEGHTHRRGHGALPDHRSGRTRTGDQSARAASGRQDRPRVRPRGDYRRIVDRCHMDNVRAATQTSPCAGDGGQRIDHRVSLRARTGHAAIGDRGDRPRRHERRAGHIRQGLGAGPRHPNRRVRQDRDDHRRSHR